MLQLASLLGKLCLVVMPCGFLTVKYLGNFKFHPCYSAQAIHGSFLLLSSANWTLSVFFFFVPFAISLYHFPLKYKKFKHAFYSKQWDLHLYTNYIHDIHIYAIQMNMQNHQWKYKQRKMKQNREHSQMCPEKQFYPLHSKYCLHAGLHPSEGTVLHIRVNLSFYEHKRQLTTRCGPESVWERAGYKSLVYRSTMNRIG